MATCVDILNLIAARRARRPALAYPGLDALFSRLAACTHADEAIRTEDRIWDAWMHHPNRAAAGSSSPTARSTMRASAVPAAVGAPR